MKQSFRKVKEIPQQKRPTWNDVDKGRGRKPRPVQYGTAKVNVAGGEAIRPYDVVIGNTHPGSTEEIIKEVLNEVAHRV